MSTDTNRFKAICISCKHEGVEIEVSDESGRTETRWEGFDTYPASDYEVQRIRCAPLKPVCACGGKDIRRAGLLPD